MLSKNPDIVAAVRNLVTTRGVVKRFAVEIMIKQNASMPMMLNIHVPRDPAMLMRGFTENIADRRYPRKSSRTNEMILDCTNEPSFERNVEIRNEVTSTTPHRSMSRYLISVVDNSAPEM